MVEVSNKESSCGLEMSEKHILICLYKHMLIRFFFTNGMFNNSLKYISRKSFRGKVLFKVTSSLSHQNQKLNMN